MDRTDRMDRINRINRTDRTNPPERPGTEQSDPKEKTITFSLQRERDEELRSVLLAVYRALQEKGGYNPVNQIVGYILSEDPTYITNYNGARSLICKLDRYELLNALVSSYLGLS